MNGQLKWITAASAVLLLAAIARAGPADTQDPPATQPATPAAPGFLPASADDLTQLPLEDLMNVEVTSVSKKKQNISDAPAAVSVISADDISRSGYDTIPDLLRLAPGVDVARINSFSWAVGVRGLNDQFSNNLLVLQDGRSLYNSLFGGVYWDTVDYVLADLDRIEVIRGPGATLWGANAVNGVINITSKDSRDTQGWLLSLRGSNDDSDLSARYGGRLSDDTTYRAYFKAKYDNSLDDASGGRAGDDWYGLRGGFRIDKHPSDDDTFTLQGDLGENRIRQPSEAVIPTAPFSMATTVSRTDATGNLLARWDHRSGDNSDFSLQVYYDYLEALYLPVNYNQNTFDIDFHQRFKLGRSDELTWGLGYRLVNSDFKATPDVVFNPSSRNDNLYSAFVQDTLTLQPERWFVTIGSKFEHNDYTGFEIQPSVRLLWKPDKQNSVWAAASRAVSTPVRVDTDTTRLLVPFQGVETDILGNRDESSEELAAYELGYRAQPVKDVSVDICSFFNNYNRLLSLEPGVPVLGPPLIVPTKLANNINGDTFGGEVSATWHVTENWRLTGSYSLLEARFHAGDAANAVSAKNDEGSAPRNQAQIHSYLDITRNLQFNAGVSYVGRVPEFDIPAYVATDLGLVWRPKDSMEFSVGVTNLFDNHHPEYAVTAGQGIASEVPRTVYAQVNYKF